MLRGRGLSDVEAQAHLTRARADHQRLAQVDAYESARTGQALLFLGEARRKLSACGSYSEADIMWALMQQFMSSHRRAAG